MLLMLDEKSNKATEISFDLETILIKELIDYKLYYYENRFTNTSEGYDDDVLNAVILALTMTLGKYLNIYGDELDNYLNKRIFGLMQFGYTPPGFVSPVVVDMFVLDLYEQLHGCEL